MQKEDGGDYGKEEEDTGDYGMEKNGGVGELGVCQLKTC